MIDAIQLCSLMRLFIPKFLLLGMLCPMLPRTAAGAVVDFARDVQPILAANCYQCHGPVTVKGKLRWDRRDSVLGRRDPVVIPGKPADSPLIRLTSPDADPDSKMPPPGKGEALTQQQVSVLKAWIEQGAIWPDDAAAGADPRYNHWAFRKPVTPALPRVRNTDWPKNPIDQFILAQLEKEGLGPSPEADRHSLIRRVSLDLIGLPPTVAEVDAFENDKSPDAYPKLVDRLLDSPHYGERWAQVWLDLARYADSRGYANDNARTIWRYRDWVIKAINDNLPYDRFTIEQLAGDLLPNATKDQILATAFHRNTLTNDEGGTDDEEFRVAAVVDRVNTTMQVWMGATLACAQCHDHKYDPISQEEYFQVYAIFNNTEDSDKNTDAPLLATARPETASEVARLEGEISLLEKVLTEASAEEDAAQQAWEYELEGGVRWMNAMPAQALSRDGATPTIQPDGTVMVSGAEPDWDTYRIWIPAGEARKITAVRLEVLPDPALPSMGPGRPEGGNFVLAQISLDLVDSVEGRFKTVPAPFVAAFASFSQKGFEVAQAINNTELRKRGWSITPQVGRAHQAVFVLEQGIEQKEGAWVVVTLDQQSERRKNTLGKFRLSFTDDPKIAQKAGIPAEVMAALDVPAEKRTEGQRLLLRRHYRTIVYGAFKQEQEQIAALSKQIETRSVETPVMRELPQEKRRRSHLLLRGNFLEKGEEVSGGVPTVFGSLSGGQNADRLALAKWLVDAENPLTARVTVNRYWEQIFGIGLVETSDDFGVRGRAPSHPELLDWLATEFPRQGWDVKRLLRMMVTSAAYRQSSRVAPELVERDPLNRLLARGPRFRVPAEVVRDQALFVGGLLSPKMFGPSVRPPQPRMGLKAAFGGSTDWETSRGDDKFRRGLYVTWRRTVLYPSMATFDAPSRTVCALRRPRTNTPLQALTTLNDPVYVEAAQALARRICREGGSDVAARAAHGFRICLARPPRADELRRLVSLFESTRSRYASDPTAALAMATEPLGSLPQGMDAAELAAWTVVGNVLLNLDEMVNKR